MNETMSLMILAAFDMIIIGFGICMLISAVSMKKTKNPGNLLLAEEELKRCQNKAELAEFFYWREAVIGSVFILCGIIHLLDKFVLKVGGAVNVIPIIILLLVACWFLKELQTARAKFL